jgi:hypothetical protein
MVPVPARPQATHRARAQPPGQRPVSGAQARQREQDLTRELTQLPALDGLAARLAVERTDWTEWTRAIAARPMEQQQAIYRECCAKIVLDPAENTLTVEYTPHIALVVGQLSCKCPL